MRVDRAAGILLGVAATWVVGVGCPEQVGMEPKEDPPCQINGSAVTENYLRVEFDPDEESYWPGEAVRLTAYLYYDYNGDEVPCAGDLEWTPGDESGTANPVQSSLDSDGRSSTTWTMGPEGDQTLVVSVVESDPAQSVTLTTGAAMRGYLAIESGDHQTAPAGEEVALSLAVSLTRYPGGSPTPPAELHWVAQGGGSVSLATTETAAFDGMSRNRWRLGSAGTPQSVVVTDPTGGSVTFTATATPNEQDHPKARISAYNGTNVDGLTVTMTTPFDGDRTFGPLATNAEAADSLHVEVGVTFGITAVLGAVQRSATCVTVASIIPDPGNPGLTGRAVASALSDGEGGLELQCSVGWQAQVAPGAVVGATPRGR